MRDDEYIDELTDRVHGSNLTEREELRRVIANVFDAAFKKGRDAAERENDPDFDPLDEFVRVFPSPWWCVVSRYNGIDVNSGSHAKGIRNVFTAGYTDLETIQNLCDLVNKYIKTTEGKSK